MDFLFVHGNYPAQFRHLAAVLGQDPQHRVVYLTARRDATKEALPGVEIRTYACHRTASASTHHYLHASEEAVLQGQAALREVGTLVESGYRPRVVVSHGGMGMGLFLKDLMPQALHIGYFEWYFRPETTRYLLDKFDLDTQLKTGLRNLPILQELERCDIAIVPTAWQKSQFPEAYQGKLKIIFDGVNTQFFHPYSQKVGLDETNLTLQNRETSDTVVVKRKRRVLSYATRGMEPLRGFPEFMRALPTLLQTFDDLDVVIAGADRRAYSYDAPTHSGSWKEHLLDELGDFKGRERIFFTGLLSYIDYRSLLWRTDLHCYFTRPYVTSWSLFEAGACGSSLAVSKGPATEGIIVEDSATWIDIEDQEDVVNGLIKGLERGRKPAQIEEGFSLDKSLEEWQKVLTDGIQKIR